MVERSERSASGSDTAYQKKVKDAAHQKKVESKVKKVKKAFEKKYLEGEEPSEPTDDDSDEP